MTKWHKESPHELDLEKPLFNNKKTKAEWVWECDPGSLVNTAMHGRVERKKSRGQPRHTWLLARRQSMEI